MTKDELYNFIYCGDISFTLNNREFFIGDTEAGWIASELPDGKEYGPYWEYDDLLDNYLIDGVPLRQVLPKVTNW